MPEASNPIWPMRSLLLAAVLAAPAVAVAQPTWRAVPQGGLSVDVLKTVPGQSAMIADLDGNTIGEADASAFHSALVLSTRLPVTRSVAFAVEIPFAFTNYDESALATDPATVQLQKTTQAGFGNPYLGIDMATKSGLRAGIGGRLPIFTVYGEGADTRGGFSETTWAAANAEQSEAFTPFAYSIAGHLGVDRAVTEAIGVRAEVAPVYINSTQTYTTVDGEQTPSAFVTRYGAQITARAARLQLGGGVVGRETIDDPYTLSVGSSTSAIASAVYAGNQFRPGLTVRVPFRGDMTDGAVVGLSLDVPLR